MVSGDGEQCDDGNISPGDGCDASCQIETDFICDNSTTLANAGTLSVCVKACGDGKKYNAHYSEQCDDGNIAPGDGCSATC